MSTSMSKKIQSQSTNEETVLIQMQGIVNTSLRRTHSQDIISCKECPFRMRKTASSEELSHSKSTYADIEEPNKELDAEAKRSEIKTWSTILVDKNDSWESILSNKVPKEEEQSNSVTPYIHPLVKRLKISLNEKSLEICTEGLGSETGSDGFFSPLLLQTEEVTRVEEELHVLPNYNHVVNKFQPRTFPPPLPSLSPSLHMRSHRHNGRLFLEAVSLPSQNNFCATRHHGRLVLTFADPSEEKEEEEEGDCVVEFEEDHHKIGEVIIEQLVPKLISSAITSLMNKPIGAVNNNFECVRLMIPETVASFNAYNEYYWRTDQPTATKSASSFHNAIIKEQENVVNIIGNNIIVPRNISQTSNDRQQLLVLRRKNGDYLVHSSKHCKDFRRSYLFWEPYGISI